MSVWCQGGTCGSAVHELDEIGPVDVDLEQCPLFSHLDEDHCSTVGSDRRARHQAGAKILDIHRAAGQQDRGRGTRREMEEREPAFAVRRDVSDPPFVVDVRLLGSSHRARHTDRKS